MKHIEPYIFISTCHRFNQGTYDGILLKQHGIISCQYNGNDIDALILLEKDKQCSDTITIKFPNALMISHVDINNESMLTKIYLKAWFQYIKKNYSIQKLINFQTVNKYLFMTYHQTYVTQMGQIVANHKHRSQTNLIEQYETTFLKLLDQTPTREKRVNTLNHIYGYFKKHITLENKALYFTTLNAFIQGDKSYQEVLNILRELSQKSKDEYLLKQAIFQPYPKALVIALQTLNM